MRPAHLVSIAALSLASAQARAATITGGDWFGADLVPADGDVLSGTFTNVREFRIPAGRTVSVQPGVALVVFAEDVLIDGVLSGVGAGDPGGAGGVAPAVGAVNGASGVGSGAGGFGTGGCTYGGGGGGAGHGDVGGRGAHVYGSIGLAGVGFGQQAGPYANPVDRPRGSGGGGGGSGCVPSDGGQGGRGGASIYLNTIDAIEMNGGMIDASGEAGMDGVDYGGGGGGGSGGTVVLAGHRLVGTGTVYARGGAGGDAEPGVVGGIAGGGGGGGGGRIKSFSGPTQPFTLSVIGGAAGISQGVGFNASIGQPGTTYHMHADLDGDNVFEAVDNCSAVPNPAQTDSNGNGVGDACDPCGPSPDVDADGVCDFADACPGADDYDDEDGDGYPDACDVCLLGDDDLDADADGVADACDACPAFDDAIDGDGDGAPDACDLCPGADDREDLDGDLLPDLCDDCPEGPIDVDADGDGVSDVCDACPDFDDTLDPDGDGVPSDCDKCPDDWDPMQLDRDGDLVGEGCDCNDLDNDVFPGGIEVCDNDDNDCNGVVDDAPTDGRPFYRDGDGDGDGDPADAVIACLPPAGYVIDGTDCDDGKPTVRGNAYEVCDGIDNNCDGAVDEVICLEPLPPTTDGGTGATACGCDAGGAGGGAWLGLVGLALLRRRQGATKP